jgi:DNA primase
VNELTVAPIPQREDKLQAYCKSIVSDFIERDMLRQKVALMGAMQRTDVAADPERYATIQRELVRIETERRVLRDE